MAKATGKGGGPKHSRAARGGGKLGASSSFLSRSRSRSRLEKGHVREFARRPNYRRLIEALQYWGTKRVAERLGVHPSTIRRWRSYGIPERTNREFRHKFRSLEKSVAGWLSKIPPSERPEKRPLYYYRKYQEGRGLAKIYIVEGLAYDQILEILLRECLNSRFHAFSFLLKFNRPLEGVWTGDKFYTEKDLAKIPLKGRREIREAGSWLDITKERPFVSSSYFAFYRTWPDLNRLETFYCHPDDLVEQLNAVWGKPYMSIYEIRFIGMLRHDDEE